MEKNSMEEYLNKLRKPMKLLDEASRHGLKELSRYYSTENIEAITILLPEFIEDVIAEDPITSPVFTSLLYKICKVNKKWGRALGNAIICAAKYADSGKKDMALTKLNDFIEICPVPYFIKHAENQRDFYLS